MQYKTLAALLFATAVVAAPAPQETDDSLDDEPSSILAVLETAVPTSYIDALYTDQAFRSSEINNFAHGSYPAWFNSLPDSVKEYYSTEVAAEVSSYNSVLTSSPTDTVVTGTNSASTASNTGTSSSGAPKTDSSSSVSHTSGASASTATATTATSASDSSSSASSDSSSSGASSSSAASSTSTGGAAVATGTVAMGLAGAAGILGLAMAL